MRKMILLVLAAALPSLGCDRQRDESRTDVGRSAAPDEHAPAAAANQGQALTDGQIASLIGLINGTEIASAKAVGPKLVWPDSRAYAERLIADHMRLREAMPPLRTDQPPPQFTTMSAIFHSQAMMLSTLPAGAPFDATFLAIQIGDHAMALDSLRRWHGAAREERLRSAIAAAVPVIEGHLEMAKQRYNALDQRVDLGRPGPADTVAPTTAPGPATVPADTAGEGAAHHHGSSPGGRPAAPPDTARRPPSPDRAAPARRAPRP